MSLKKMLITGGAGFIGSNAAAWFARRGWYVVVLDNFSRRGSRKNAEALRARHNNIAVEEADVREFERVCEVCNQMGPFDAILHLAAQVAVTTAVNDPRTDFEVNALGTLNVLEAARKYAPDAALVYASTNKVYGNLADLPVELCGTRYVLRNCDHGICEEQSLDFHSPYGCSKGAADQYVLDYARIYGLKAVSFRQSCIYGPNQFGIEDQGWLAWFVIAAHAGHPITIYGDGRQVRDVLYVTDLCGAFERAIGRIGQVAGEAFNIGGGPGNSLSLLEALAEIKTHLGRNIELRFAGWRPGDQKVFISDVRKAKRMLDWQPSVPTKEGIRRLCEWVKENAAVVNEVLFERPMA